LQNEFTLGSNKGFETTVRKTMRMSDRTVPIENTLDATVGKDAHDTA
jgi:hypothetical protein